MKCGDCLKFVYFSTVRTRNLSFCSTPHHREVSDSHLFSQLMSRLNQELRNSIFCLQDILIGKDCMQFTLLKILDTLLLLCLTLLLETFLNLLVLVYKLRSTVYPFSLVKTINTPHLTGMMISSLY